MKFKKILLVAIISIAGNNAFSQITYGPLAGINIGTLKFTNDDYKTSFLPGFYAGGFANYMLKDKIAVQAELFFSIERGKEKYKYGNFYEGSVTMGYIQLPVLFQYGITEKIYVQGGPQLGFLVSAREKWEDDDRHTIKEYYKPIDIRLPFGAGYAISDKLKANIRYSFSLSKTNKVPIGGSELRMHVISLGAQYQL